MGTRAFKDDLYPRFANVAAALGSPKRFEILDLLAQSERSVDDLARETDLSIANASQHLRKLHGNHWSAEIIALCFVTAMCLQEGHLSYCFYAFTDYTLLKTLGHCDNCSNNRGIIQVASDVAHE